ncbi:MAG: N-acetylglucosamine-6-phosphate deacetylase [Cytophagales bacterium]|nr:MAG: N-acetylglucosamine-6-phosphate deacetylase [Cytophagales bacterium]
MEKLIVQSIWNNSCYELSLEKGKVVGITPLNSAHETELLMGAGLVDIQVNGYGGVDYNILQEDFLTLGQISEKLAQNGVTQHFPTLITNSKEQLGKLFEQLSSLLDSSPNYQSAIPGFHLEGPFISPEDGPRGAHFKEFVTAPKWDWFQFWQEKANGKIRLITLSPEWVGSVAFIEKCVDSGVLVSIGHTNANQIQIADAVKAGARLSTHLGNATHLKLPRHPNYLWSQLAEEELWTSVIADGFHLPAEVLKVFAKVKGEKLFLVSDSVALAGMPSGTYTTQVGGKVTLTQEGKLHLADQPQVLAGSARNLLQGINFLVKNQLATLKEAWEMASIRPQSLFESKSKKWTPDPNSDFILGKLDSDSQLCILKTFQNGREIYSKPPIPNS